MEEGGGGGVGIVRRRLSLSDHMSALGDRQNSLAGLTLDAILSQKRSDSTSPTAAAAASSRTLLDIIRDEDHSKGYGKKDKKSWKIFRDGIRIKRAGAAWTSSVQTPASDILISHPRPIGCRRRAVRYDTEPSSSDNPTQSTQAMSQSGDSASGPPPPSSRPSFTRRGSTRFGMSANLPHESTSPNGSTDSSVPGDGASDTPNMNRRPTFTRRGSTRFGLSAIPTDSSNPHDSPDASMPGDGPPGRSFRPQMSMSRHGSTLFPSNPESEVAGIDHIDGARDNNRRLAAALADERAMSAREAVAAQEAAEAEAAAAAAASETAATEGETGEATDEAGAVATPREATPRGGEPEEAEPVRMSLMDLLEETDRQMGVVGSKYSGTVEAEEEEEEEEETAEEEGAIEHTCCVCMVRHKGAAFIPCGHTFCRLCSRELWVQRGNCPLCNNFILEILDIF